MFTKTGPALCTPGQAGALEVGGLLDGFCGVSSPLAKGDPMPTVLSLFRSRAAAVVGVCGLALMQAACAYPVVAEPTVAVHARLGGPVYGSVYAPVYGPPPVVVAPQPMWGPAPAVVMAPRMMVPPPAYYGHAHRWHGQGFNHGWGRRW